jgi:iron complex outermembrane receptor protein
MFPYGCRAGDAGQETSARARLASWVVALFLLVAAAVPASAGGDDLTDLSLESLMQVKVVGASRYEQKLTEAPSYVSVVTREDIQRFGYRNLGAVLRSMPGVYTSFDRGYTYLGVRGFSPPGDFNTRVLLVVDGHRINNNVYDQALLGNEFPIDIDLVERVEFVRGPSSSLYGSNAFFGIVNVITRRGKKLNGVELSGSVASFDTYQGRVSYGQEIQERAEVLVSATAGYSGGQTLVFPEFDDPATHSGVAVGADAERLFSGFAKVVLGDFTVEGVTGYRKKNIPTAYYGTTFNDNRTFVADMASYVDLRYDRVFSGDLELTARLFLDYSSYYGDYAYSTVLQRDYARGAWWGAEFRAQKKWWDRLLGTGGVEYRNSALQEQGTSNYDPPEVVFLDSRRSYVLSGYLQGEFRILPNLLVNAGVRYDYYDTFGGNWSPRVGLIWSPWERTTTKLLYGSAFRVPNVYELYYSDTVSLKANPTLRPETIDTFELVLEQFFDLLGMHWKGTAAGFYYWIGNLIAATPDPVDPGFTAFQNSATIDAYGLELELDGRTKSGLGGRASYSIQWASVRGSGSSLSNAPRSTAKINLFLPIVGNKLSLNPELQYVSSRTTVPGKATEAVAGYALINLTLLSQELAKGLELSASVYNLLGTSYSDPVGNEFVQDAIRQDGMNFRLKATYRF